MTLILLTLLVLTKPDLTLTPGVVRPLTTAQVCAVSWGRDRRHVTQAMKQEVFRRYGIPWREHAKFEVDHKIPRELAGADVLENLWPQPWPEARVKDQRENALRRAVCAGTVSLLAAQAEMRAWGR